MNKSAKGTFDIRSLLPPEFEICDAVNPVVNVVPPPSDLQNHLGDQITAKTATQDDISSLLSQNHLGHLYTRFLGPRQAKSRAATDQAGSSKKIEEQETTAVSKHPLWDDISTIIEQSTDVPALQSSPNYLSYTITDNIKQYSTTVSTLWEGSILTKLLEYTLRTLLRIHLAPQREKKSKEKSNRTEQQGSRDASPGNSKAMTKTQWRSRVRALCDELSDALQGKGNGVNGKRAEYRMALITKKLRDLQASEPTPKNFRIQPLDERILSVANTCDYGTLDLDEYDGDLDAYYSDDENDEEDEGGNDDTLPEVNKAVEKDSTSKRIRALKAVAKMLLESPSINHNVSALYVGSCAFKDTTFTKRECEVVAMIVNTLGPFIPKRRPKSDGPGTQESIPHVALRAPFAFIANTILRATGYHSFTRRVVPGIVAGAIHGLAMGATGMYEVFCAKSPGHFDINDFSGSPLTYVKKAVSPPQNKKAVFGSFFDMDHIHHICRAHGLTFADR